MIFRRKGNGIDWHKLLMLTLTSFLTPGVLSDTRSNECTGSSNNQICITPGCIHTSSDILKAMDPAVDPCDDFYQFTCGSLIKNNQIPDDQYQISRFTDLDEVVILQLRNSYEQSVSATEPRFIKILKQMYGMCMNTTQLEINGLNTAKALLQELGGWPVLEGEGWNETDFNWKKAMYRNREKGLPSDSFININVMFDTQVSSKRMLWMDEVGLIFLRGDYVAGIEGDTMKRYLDYLVKLAVIFGANQETAMREMRESVQFQIELAQITTPQEDRRNLTALINRDTIREYQTKFPNFPFLEYINKVAGTSGHNISDTETLSVAIPNYLNKLEILLNGTPKRVQANYVMGEVLREIGYWLTEELFNLNWELKSITFGPQTRRPRWKDCTDFVSNKLDVATSNIYVHNYFDDDANRLAKEMVGNFKAEFIKTVQLANWMDTRTKEKAIEKANALTVNMGYHQEVSDNNLIESYYSELNSSEDYLQLHLNIRKFSHEKSFNKLHEPVNKTDWRESPSAFIVNAYYSMLQNSIEFPAAILQGAFFNKRSPNYMNYGGIGYLVGHEITHGFDDQGRKTTKDGLFSDWWSEETSEIYINKSQCIQYQYGNYTVPHLNLTINGINTLGENIADNGGVKMAYAAYKTWATLNGQEPQLPGLNFTSNQMFWISAANIWCSKDRDAFLRNIIGGDPHAPSNFRVIGVFGNIQEFSNDFNCALGSKMNPVRKCQVW